MTKEVGLGGSEPEVIIRRACYEDLHSVSELVAGPLRHKAAASRVDTVPELDSIAQQRNWRRMLRTPDLSIYVAEADGILVGTVMLMVMPNLGYRGRPTAFVEALKVLEAFRRRGVGRRLMDQLLSDASALGCHKIQLLTHKRHAEDGAFDFYRSLDFEPEAEGFRLYLG